MNYEFEFSFLGIILNRGKNSLLFIIIKNSRIIPKKIKLLVSKFLKFGSSIFICKANMYGIVRYIVKIKNKTLPICFIAFMIICFLICDIFYFFEFM